MDQRITEVVERLVPAIERALDEVDLTEAEYYAALEWLNRVGAAGEAILLADVLHLSRHVIDHNRRPGATAGSLLGPFFRPDAPPLGNPGRLSDPDEPGTPFVVTGQVRSAEDEGPLPGTRIDFWQSDASGRYDVQHPGRPMRLRGWLTTDVDGRYEVTTILPEAYPVPTDGPVGELLAALERHAWRPAHLHVKAEASSFESLVTSVFIEGSEWLDEGDVVAGVVDSLVVACPTGGDGVARATFDLHLSPA